MVVLISDASSRMGEAIAREFARRGKTVILAGKCRERLDTLAAGLDTSSTSIVTDWKPGLSLDAAMTSLPEACRAIDVLINTAGTTAEGEPDSQAQSDDFASAAKRATHALLDTIRPVLPFLGRGGRILNLALAERGDKPHHPTGYGMMKVMLDNVTRILGNELIDAGIQTTCVVVGYRGEPELSLNENEDRSGAGRALSPADIAEAIYWVASQASSRYVNHIDMLPTDLPFTPTPRELR